MTAVVRSVDGIDLPAPGVWTIDPGHADVAFVGRHLGLAKVRGHFTGVTGAVVFGDALADSSVEVTIAMASVDSGNATRDDHLRAPDLFDVAGFPEATFRSTGVNVDGASAAVHGDLTIRGVTRAVTLDVEYLGHVADPWGNNRAAFSATTVINREDWGMTWNMVLDTGGLLVSKEITLEIDLELVRQPD